MCSSNPYISWNAQSVHNRGTQLTRIMDHMYMKVHPFLTYYELKAIHHHDPSCTCHVHVTIGNDPCMPMLHTSLVHCPLSLAVAQLYGYLGHNTWNRFHWGASLCCMIKSSYDCTSLCIISLIPPPPQIPRDNVLGNFKNDKKKDCKENKVDQKFTTSLSPLWSYLRMRNLMS